MSKGGKNQVQTLKDVLGADVIGRTDAPTIALDDIWVHPKGHKLRHPRLDDPIDVDLRDDIVEKGVTDPLTLRLESHSGKMRAALCDGACRRNAGLAAQAIMRKQGSKHLDDKGNLKVRTIWLKCDDGEFLLKRRAADKQPLKRPHSVRVTCDEIVALSACNVEPDRILEGLSRDWSLSVVSSVAELWHTADAALRERLNVIPGRAPEGVPPGILPAVLKAAPEDRLRTLEDLLESGMTSPGGATRALKRMALEAEAAAEDDIARDGLDSDKYRDPDDGEPAAAVVGGDEEAEEVEDEADVSAPKSPRREVAKASPRVRSLTQAPVARKVRQLADDLANRKSTAAERFFALGAQAGLGLDEVRERVLGLLKDAEVPEAVRCALAGMLWRRGLFPQAVQKHLPPAVCTMVASVTVEKPPSKKGRATK